MSTPVTTLDQRFSAPDTAATEWDQTRGALESAQLFWISTVRADGRPHVTPLVAVWLDDALHFCTGPTEQKYLNLSGNPQVILTTGSNGYEDGLDVVVEGEAVRVNDDEQLRRLAEAWKTKWDGEWEFDVHDGDFHHADGESVCVFSVKPAKVLAFGKGKFTHTRHKF